VLAGRSAPTVTASADQLGLPHRELSLDDPAALDGVDLVLNATGPFLHTSAPLAQTCLAAGVHYLDIGIDLQAFRALYDLDQRAQDAWVTSMPGTGFGVVATNCLARYVSAAVGGAANPRSRQPGGRRTGRPGHGGIQKREHALRRMDPPGGPPRVVSAQRYAPTGLVSPTGLRDQPPRCPA
jgi:hypothetical protein